MRPSHPLLVQNVATDLVDPKLPAALCPHQRLEIAEDGRLRSMTAPSLSPRSMLMPVPSASQVQSGLAAAGKIAFVAFVVIVTFLSAFVFGLSADGHSLYSPDHRIWRETAGQVWETAMWVGGISMWLLVILGGRVSTISCLKRAGLALFAAFLLHWLMFPRGSVDFISSVAIDLVVAGSLVACAFAVRHPWRALALASMPYVTSILAIVAFLLFAPPNTGAVGG